MASSLSLVVTGRFLLGFGLGMAIPIMALYIPEISPPQQRGTFGAIPQVLTCTGILAALLAAALLPASSWRMCFWIAAVPAALFCMACEFLVDSPRWLAQVRRWGREVWRYGIRCRITVSARLPAALFCMACAFLVDSPRWLAQHGKWSETAAAVTQLLGEAKVKETTDDLLHHSLGPGSHPLSSPPTYQPQHGKSGEAAAAVAQLLGEAKVKPALDDLHHSLGPGSHPLSSLSIPPDPTTAPSLPLCPRLQHGKWAEAAAAVTQLLGEAKVGGTMDDLHHSFGGRGSRGHDVGWEGEAKGEKKEGKGEQQHPGYVVLEKGKGVAVAGKGDEEGLVKEWGAVEKVTWQSLFSKRYVRGAALSALQLLSANNAVLVFSSHASLPLTFFVFFPCHPSPFPIVTIGATLFALQQLSGINAVFFFSSHLFKSAGIQSGAMASVAMGTLNLVASLVCSALIDSSLVCSALIDRVGRKALITGSFIGMGLCMAVQAAAQVLPWMGPMAPLITLTATLVYVACFTMGAGPVPGLMLPEMLPNHIRAKGMAFAMCVHWVLNFMDGFPFLPLMVFNFMVGFSFLPLMVRFGQTTLFSFFACVCFAGALFTATSLVETAGRSLEEIEEQLLPPA
ncbi:unnamed protein product [Closterium sp. NIES-65]|nr:unnamed protein product [Closterium sp. NIES-65]